MKDHENIDRIHYILNIIETELEYSSDEAHFDKSMAEIQRLTGEIEEIKNKLRRSAGKDSLTGAGIVLSDRTKQIKEKFDNIIKLKEEQIQETLLELNKSDIKKKLTIYGKI